MTKKITAAVITSVAATAAVVLPLLAQAQSSTATTRSQAATRPMTSSTADSYSLLPGTTRGYVYGSVGRAEYDTPCSLGCDDPDVSFKVGTGGSWSEIIGLELNYLNFGQADRNGGETEAQGVNLSLVGNLPIGEMFNLFAKIGTTYGWTDTTARAGFVSGDDNGFGLSYGLGAGVDLTRNWTVQAEWEQHRLKFVSGRDEVSLLSVGVKYRF